MMSMEVVGMGFVTSQGLEVVAEVVVEAEVEVKV